MADLLVTMLVGWYGFGVLAGLVLLGTQLVEYAGRGLRAARATGRPERVQPIVADGAPAPLAEPRVLAPEQPAASGHDAVPERRRAG